MQKAESKWWEFCQHQFKDADFIGDLAMIFVTVSLIFLVLLAIVELVRSVRDLKKTAADLQDAGPADQLAKLIAALKDAPAWLAAFALGVMLFWAAGASIPERCMPDVPSAKPGQPPKQ